MAEAPRITTAGRSHSDEVWSREKRYIITMAIRTLCFLLAAGFAIAGITWLAWVFVPAAVFLPYVAVVMANAGSSPDPTRAQLYDVPRKAIAPTDPEPDDRSSSADSAADR